MIFELGFLVWCGGGANGGGRFGGKMERGVEGVEVMLLFWVGGGW